MRSSAVRFGVFRKVMFAVGAVFAIVFLGAAPLQAGGTLYLIDGNSLYTVDVSTVDVDRIGPSGRDDGLAPSEVPSSLYCTHNEPSLYRLPVDGTPQVFIATIGGDADRGLAFNVHTKVLYGTDNSIFGSIGQTTGAFTPLASPPSEAEALAADPINNLVYGLAREDTPDLMVYDVSTDMWSVIGSTTIEDGDKAGLAFDPVSGILYAGAPSGEPGGLYSIDPSTAATTWIGTIDLGGSGGDFWGLAFVSDLVFSDGFESGSTDQWSSTAP